MAKPSGHAGHKTSSFLGKFWISLILTIPILAYSDLPEALFSWQFPAFVGSRYLALILGSIVFFYSGWVFLMGAWHELRARLPGMMTLIAIAVSAAYFFSVGSVISGKRTHAVLGACDSDNDNALGPLYRDEVGPERSGSLERIVEALARYGRSVALRQ